MKKILVILGVIVITGCQPHFMRITSSDFGQNASIPQKYTCNGENISPPLTLEEAPAQTISFALIVEDPDAPAGTFIHWTLWNIPGNTKEIAENTHPGVQGTNSAGITQYASPCPPSGTHRYIFRVYALDSTLDIPEGSNVESLRAAIKKHTLAEATLIGTYAQH